ncbi:MAG TPA: biotin synthase BioB [Acidimicrobiales bacterium]|nr:biotin synthase BioB [Acidimicrobiales bacterium]
MTAHSKELAETNEPGGRSARRHAGEGEGGVAPSVTVRRGTVAAGGASEEPGTGLSSGSAAGPATGVPEEPGTGLSSGSAAGPATGVSEAPGDALLPGSAAGPAVGFAELPPGWLEEMALASLAKRRPSRQQALAVLRSGDAELLDVVAAAARVRRAFFGNRVKLNYLVNMKSGLCQEDCSYCSQRRGSQAGVLKYNWVGPEEAAREAESAASRGARRICLVASGRGPTDRDIERVAATVQAIRSSRPGLEVCTCLGLLEPGQAERLKEAGAYAYNHNLNTAPSFYDRICSTHTFDDRAKTVRQASAAGLSPCSGVVVGMGESDQQLVDVAFALYELRPESVPVNFLMPFDGTPLAGHCELTPAHCLRVLAMFRFFFPDAEVRIAGGREMHLRSLQALGLHVANSIFLGDYLTSEGAAGSADLEMIADAGFVIEGAEGVPLFPDGAPPAAPVVRRRGPGTGVPANR